VVAAPAVVAAPPPPPRVAARPAIANAGACAPKAEDYPAAAVRAEATGTTKIRFTIGPDGRVTGNEVVRSAGASREHKMLDRLAQAKLGECQFKPGTDENGRPVGASFDVEYVWKLD
jgi:protein TonB